MSDTKKAQILTGAVEDILPELEECYFEGCFCDPPYGLEFMGRAWDQGVPPVEIWEMVLRVLKPGAFLLAFGGSRTYHRLAVAIEDAGFEIRDSIHYLYGVGFPKNYNVEKAFRRAGEHYLADYWKGYGTALKPAFEPIILAQKPRDKNFTNNLEVWGTGALNIDHCRVPRGEITTGRGGARSGRVAYGRFEGDDGEVVPWSNKEGGWPANIITDEFVRDQLYPRAHHIKTKEYFYYCAKASRAEREAGLENFEPQKVDDGRKVENDTAYQRGKTLRKNHHPTAKPLELNEYLARLILPAIPNARLLNPFSGSGSEAIGAFQAGWGSVTSIELEPEYVEISKARLSHWVGEVCIEDE